LGGPGVYATTAAIAAPASGSDGTLRSDATVSVRSKVAGEAAGAGEYAVRISLVDALGTVAGSSEQPVGLAGRTAEVGQNISVASARLWHGVADPYLYQLVADLLTPDGTLVDRVVQRFGIRELRFDPSTGLSLNGQPLRLRGVSIHQDYLGKSWAVSSEDFDTSLAFFTEIGANAIRLAHYPYAEYPLERIDELGLVAWAEAVLGMQTTVESCAAHDASEQFVDNALRQLSEMIRQQYNHAAIAMWSVGNESTITQDRCGETYDNITPVLRALHERAKVEDPSRPTTYAEFADSPNPKERSFPTAGITDLYATNRYYLWYNQAIGEMPQLLDDLDAYLNQPLAVSEYGAGSAIAHHTDNPRGGLPEVRSAPEGEVSYQPEEYAAYAHEENYRILASKPYLWGTFAWAMFDYGSTRRREGGMKGVNTKGLVTFDRATRKDAFYFYKANWSREPVTYIVGRRHGNRPYPIVDVKVYSNADAVDLSVNGVAAATMTQCEQKTCVFEDVRLEPGANTVTATGHYGAELLTDSVEWTYAGEAIRIAAGRLATGYVAKDGARYGSDEFFAGGEPANILLTSRDLAGGPVEVRNTGDPLLYKYLRLGNFRYEIPLANGRYDVMLGFVEPERRGGRGKREFDVVANGETVIEDLDVFEEAGGARIALRRAFSVDVGSGALRLEFAPERGDALVSVIDVVRSE
jgi:beta-galactosidase